MNQDSSFPPMLPPSTELGALLFAVLPCLQETYRPLASFAYHMTELTTLKNIPAVPSLTGMSGIEALITDKDIMLRSLSFYGKLFRMPLLSTMAALLQGFQLYRAYKDILPGLFGDANTGGNADLFSMLGGLSPDLFSSLFSGFSGGNPFGNAFTASPKEDRPTDTASPTAQDTSPSRDDRSPAPQEASLSPDDIPPSTQDAPLPSDNAAVTPAEASPEHPTPEPASDTTDNPAFSDPLYNSLYSFLTPEQQKIYEQLMHTE